MILGALVRLCCTTLVAGTIGVVLGCGGMDNVLQSGVRSANPATPSSEAREATTASALDPIATALNAYCQQAFPDDYSGLEVQPSEGDIVVYRHPKGEFDNAVRARFPSTRIVFRDSRFSQRYLQQLTQRILADAPFWRSQGIDIVSVGPMVDGSGVQIGTPQAPSARESLQARYGADRIHVVPRILGNGVASPTGRP